MTQADADKVLSREAWRINANIIHAESDSDRTCTSLDALKAHDTALRADNERLRQLVDEYAQKYSEARARAQTAERRVAELKGGFGEGDMAARQIPRRRRL